MKSDDPGPGGNGHHRSGGGIAGNRSGWCFFREPLQDGDNSQNDATVDGGGIASNAGSNLTIVDTTDRNNSAIGLAGGVMVNAVTNSTITR